MIAGFCKLYSLKEALLGYFNQLSCLGSYLSDHMSPCRIRLIPFPDHTCIQADYVALIEITVFAGNSVNHLIIDGNAHGSGISLVIQEGRDTSMAADHLFTDAVDLLGGNSRLYDPAKLLMDLCKNLSCLPHQFNFTLRFNRYHGYAPKIFTIAWNTSSISRVPSTSARTPSFL